jgi:hypothetical protein
VAKAKMEPTERACAVCRRVIQPGDHVVAGHGELLHTRCRAGWSEVAQRLALFLADRDGKRFCHTCLVGQLDITYEETRRAVALLRGIHGVRVRVATCSRCDEPRVTVQGRNGRISTEDSELRERIFERLQAGGLPRFLVTVDHGAVVPSGLFTGPGTGKLCSGCDAVLDGVDGRSLEFVMPPGHVLRFHRRCYQIWEEERHNAHSR